MANSAVPRDFRVGNENRELTQGSRKRAIFRSGTGRPAWDAAVFVAIDNEKKKKKEKKRTHGVTDALLPPPRCNAIVATCAIEPRQMRSVLVPFDALFLVGCACKSSISVCASTRTHVRVFLWVLRNVCHARCCCQTQSGHAPVRTRFAGSTRQITNVTRDRTSGQRDTQSRGQKTFVFIPAAIHVSLRSPHSVHDHRSVRSWSFACAFPVFYELSVCLSEQTHQWGVSRPIEPRRSSRGVGKHTPLKERERVFRISGAVRLRQTFARAEIDGDFRSISIFFFFPSVSQQHSFVVSDDVGDAGIRGRA